MTGLKSGSGDDLWGDDEDPDDAVDEQDAPDEQEGDVAADVKTDDADTEDAAAADAAATDSAGGTESDTAPVGSNDVVSMEGSDQSNQQPYIVRRAIQDKSVQFERDERLTFFVHDDVVDGERELLMDAEAALGRDVPKFDIREAVYRAALRNKEDVIAELVRMGYSTSD